MQNKVLIVDGDTRSLRLLEVSLKQAGYRVGTATSGLDALGQLEVEVPDLLLADTAIGEVDGFALYARLQQRPEWAHLPFIFILDGEDATQKLRAVQLGVSDFLTKPVFLKEALSRVELLLEKQAQRGEGPSGKTPTSGRARFSGALSGTALLDLLQTMELGRKSGIAYCQSGRGQRAVVYFAGGVVVDAELGRLRGTEALYRILTFQGGEYRVELLTVVRPARIEMSTPGLLMEAMRFLEEWNRLCAALPPLTSALLPATLGGAAGALRPESLPVELREVLQLFDGQRSVLDVLDILDQEAEPPHDLLLRLGAVAKLYAARLLTLAGRPVSGEPRAPVPTPLAVPRLIPPAARLTPPPLPRLTPPPLPRLTPSPAARLTPPPLPRLTPPPLLADRAAALSSSGRPTPVSLPRAVVKTPAPLSDSAAVTLPAELLITLVPGQPPPRPADLAPAGESPAATDAYPPPLPSLPAVRPTPVEQPVVRGAARSLPPMLPRAAGGATPALPPALASPRPTPPPLPTYEAASPTPAVPMTASPLPASELSSEAAHLKQTMRWSGQATPTTLSAQEAVRYPPTVPIAVSPPAPAPKPEAAHLKQTMRWSGQAAPTPPPAQEPSRRYTPAFPAEASPPPAPETSAEGPRLRQTMPGGPRLTPPPMPAQGAGRYTPAFPAEASPPPVPETSAEGAHLRQTMPGGPRLTPPPMPAQGAGRYTPAFPMEVSPSSAPTSNAEVAQLKQTMPRGARLTPPPIPARDIPRLTPAVAVASMGPTTPNAEEEPLEGAPGSAWLSSSALRLEPEPLEAEAPGSAWLSSSALRPEAELLEREGSGSARLTPPPLSFAAGSLEPASARLTPSPLASLDAARLTPVPESRATPPPLPDEAPTWVPLGGAAAGGSDSSAAPGNNLTRLAQRLAATRQPLPFVAPSLPSSAVAAAAPGNSDPGFAAAVQMTAAGENSGRAAGPVRGGSVPELEPISIPDFELMIEHSAPSWLPAPEEDRVTPGSELRDNKTLPVQLRSQYRAASSDAPAVHISAPVLLPADPATAVLPPIEVEVPPAPLLLPPPARGTTASRQRWGKVVAWAVAGTALFSLGAGLYWVRQELDRGIAMPGQKGAAPPAAMPESPVSAPPAVRQPKVSQPKVSQPPTGPATGSQPTGAQSAVGEPRGSQPASSPAAGSQPTGAQSAVGEPTGALASSAPPTAEVAPASPAGRPTSEAAAVPTSARSSAPPSPAPPTSVLPSAPPSPVPPTGAVVAAVSPAVGSAADPAAGVGAATPPAASGAFAALITKARAFEHRGALAAAYHAAHGAQRLQPRSAEVFALLAQLALDEGNADKAAGLAKRARYLDPRNADAYLVLGTVEQARSRSASARTFFKKYLELAPNGERAVEVRAVLHSGR